MRDLKKHVGPLPATANHRWSDDLKQKIAQANDARKSQAGDAFNAGAATTGADLVFAPDPDDQRKAYELAAERSTTSSHAPERAIDGVSTGNDRTTPIRLLYDWWDGQGIRHERENVVDVPMNEAIKLIGEGKAERADPLPGA